MNKALERSLTGRLSTLAHYIHVLFQVLVHQTLLSMEFSRQEYWSRLLFPPPEDLPDPGMERMSLLFPALAGGFFTTLLLHLGSL